MASSDFLQSYKNTKKGYPLLLHSFKPYSAFNFQATALFTISGQYTWAGIMGLSRDGENYIIARYNGYTVQLCKVRDGSITVLSETEYELFSESVPQISFYIYFSHKDGNFSVHISTDTTISTPILTYRWQDSDGEMCVDNDLFHIGVYSFIDPPRFRITSFDSKNCEGIPYLPGTELSMFDLFPTSGTVQIDDAKYTYTGKTPNALPCYRGPYQVRRIGSASYTNPDSGLAFSGKYLEVAMFDWSNVRNDFNGYFLATDAQYAWLITDVDRKTFYSGTNWNRSKARFFCQSKGVVSTTHRAWITCGLTGVMFSEGSGSEAHNHGSLCFLDTNDSATLHKFTASSGDKDATVGDLLDSVGKMAGLTPVFPGDIVYPSITISSSGEEL